MNIPQNSFQYKNLNPSKNVSFKSEKIYNVPLEMAGRKIATNFSKIAKEDLYSIVKKTQEIKVSEYGKTIVRAIVDKVCNKSTGTDFYMMEKVQKNPFVSDIKALAYISRAKDVIEVEYIQTLKDAIGKIKALGVSLLYGICREALDTGVKKIELWAANEGLFEYYERLGFKRVENKPYRYILERKDFEAFLKNIEDKYYNGKRFEKLVS